MNGAELSSPVTIRLLSDYVVVGAASEQSARYGVAPSAFQGACDQPMSPCHYPEALGAICDRFTSLPACSSPAKVQCLSIR